MNSETPGPSGVGFLNAPDDAAASGTLLRAILNGSADGFTVLDADWRVTYMNAASVNRLRRQGKTLEDLTGRSLWEALPEAVGTPFYAHYQRAMREQTPVEFEEYYPPLNAWLQVRLFPSPEGLLAYTHEVTAEKELRASLDERTRALALSADVGRALTSGATLRGMLQGCAEAMVRHFGAAFARIWTLNEAGDVLELEASAGMYTHIDGGHSRVPVGMFKIGLIAAERTPHLTNQVVGDPRVGDQEWAKREGMVAFAGYPLLVEDRLVGVAAMFAREPLSPAVLDSLKTVADEIALGILRKRIEEELASSREWFSTTLSSVGDAVIATDRTGAVLFMNPVAAEMTGYVPDEARGRLLTDIFPIVNERTGQPVENPVERVLREGQIVGLANHTVLVARDGVRRPIEDSAAPIRDERGELTGVVLVFHDVTDRRQAERRAEAQYRVSAALASAPDWEVAADATMEAIGDSLGCRLGILWMRDAASGELYVMRTWQSPEDRETASDAALLIASRGQNFRSGDGLPGRILASGQPLWIEDLRSDPQFPRRREAASDNVRSGLGFLLQSGPTPLGVMEFFHTEPQPPDAEMLRTLEGLGQQIGQFLERQRAAADAIRSGALRAAMLASSLDGIVSMDHTGRVAEWNAEAERMFGYSREEALGRELADLIVPPSLREAHRAGLARYLSGGDGPVIGRRVEVTGLRRDGSEFPVELAINRIAGEPPRFTGFLRDITERQRAESEQQRLANDNRLLLQSTGEGIYGLDLDGKCTFLNAAGARLLQVEPSAVLGKDMHEITHHHRADGSPYPVRECPIARSFREGVGCRVDDEVFWRADGTAFPVEYSSFPIVEDGAVRGAVVTFSDITERERTRRALQASEARYQRIAANVPGMVYQFVLHPDGAVDFPFVSEYSRELFGIAPERVTAQPTYLIESIHPDDRPSFDRSVVESARTLLPWKWEGRFRRADGEYRWIEGASRPAREANGDIVWDGLLVDITARKQSEEELRQARDEAEAATRAKSQFLATMSHEIRTPMNAVIGMTGLLLDTPLAPAQQEFVQVIRDSGDALLTVINDILDFSKIEAGQMEIEQQPFDLRECVESALDLVAGRAAEKGLELACLIAPDAPLTVVGDVTRVRQILVNLLSNAVKFTQEGEVVVSVSAAPLSDGPHGIRLDVRDTGIGIPPDRMDRLFRSFSQVDASTTRRYGGTGLGLVISKRLCEMMGGQVWAESTVGRGSTFHVVLPMPVSPHAPFAQDHPDEEILEGRRLLIVDDNETNRQILCLQAESWRMEAHACATGAEALGLLRAGEHFDIAILDIQMPDMDGITLAEEIRRFCGDRTPPLVGLSSVGARLSEVAQGGFAQMLTKPIKQSPLYNVLVGALSERPRARDASPAEPAANRPAFDADLGKQMPLRILVGEDLAVNQKLMQALLAKFGYRADVAGNGLEVLQALERQQYDLVLMDVQMPEMDGLEASRQIHRRFGDRRPRIAAFTANAMREDRALCIAAGMDDYAAKPVKPETLREILVRCGEWLQGREAGRRQGADKPPAAEGHPAPPDTTADGSHSSVEEIIDPVFRNDLLSMRDLLPELVATFRRDVGSRLDDILTAVAGGDPAVLATAAHAVKGAAGNIGGSRLAALCRALEEKGKAGTVEGAGALLPDVEAEFEKLCAALESLVEDGAA